MENIEQQDQNGLSMAAKKEVAKALYLKNAMTQKDMAAMLQVSENAVCEWVKKGNWDQLRKTLSQTKHEQLIALHRIHEGLLREAEEAINDGDPATKPDSDGINKIASAIRKLEDELDVSDKIQTAMDIMRFVASESPTDAQVVGKWCLLYVESEMAKK